ncbi:hypothetical protein V1514DRAFT_354881 [Lipomyces japonicus]|uniref:uncharacterized protein n=1 Tax=Lipomyces japonicus TaxID=56871 RepID=UPI0034CD2FB6
MADDGNSSSNGQIPSQTLYIRNIDEAVKIPILKESLETIFSRYGQILDVVAHQNIKMRGQAFVVFDSVESAGSAKDDVDGFPLFDKPIVIQYAKSKSDATVQKDGEDALEHHKKLRLAEKERLKAEAEAAAKKRKRPTGAQASGRPAKKGVVPDEKLPPNKILFLQNLPDSITAQHLTEIFEKFSGFYEVRLVPGRSGIAFVEYEADENAIVAKEGTADVKFDNKKPKITYARK